MLLLTGRQLRGILIPDCRRPQATLLRYGVLLATGGPLSSGPASRHGRLGSPSLASGTLRRRGARGIREITPCLMRAPCHEYRGWCAEVEKAPAKVGLHALEIPGEPLTWTNTESRHSGLGPSRLAAAASAGHAIAASPVGWQETGCLDSPRSADAATGPLGSKQGVETRVAASAFSALLKCSASSDQCITCPGRSRDSF